MSNRLFCISVVIVMLAAAPGVAQTSISDATRSATGELTAEQKAEVDAFIDFCTRRITAQPADMTLIKSCRVALITTYGGKQGDGFMRYFATSMTKRFVDPALNPRLSAVALVNAAMAVGAVDRAEMGPGLLRMLGHPNAAVRYYAAKGFAKAQAAIVAEGPGEVDKMLTTVAARLSAEANPSVIRALAQAMDLSSTDAADPALNAARAKARGLLTDLITRHLQAVRDGNVGVADATGYAVRGLGSLGAMLAVGERTAVMQTVADVMANASAAYGEMAIQTDEDGRERISAAPSGVSMLLAWCEQAIGQMAGQKETSVSRAINASPQKTDVLKVQLNVNKLVGAGTSPGRLEAVGVTAPTVLIRSAPAQPGE